MVRIFFFPIQAFLVIMDNKVYSSAKNSPLVYLQDLLCSTERKDILLNIFWLKNNYRKKCNCKEIKGKNEIILIN